MQVPQCRVSPHISFSSRSCTEPGLMGFSGRSWVGGGALIGLMTGVLSLHVLAPNSATFRTESSLYLGAVKTQCMKEITPRTVLRTTYRLNTTSIRGLLNSLSRIVMEAILPTALFITYKSARAPWYTTKRVQLLL